jgi:hypothetical protein
MAFVFMQIRVETSAQVLCPKHSAEFLSNFTVLGQAVTSFGSLNYKKLILFRGFTLVWVAVWVWLCFETCWQITTGWFSKDSCY